MQNKKRSLSENENSKRNFSLFLFFINKFIFYRLNNFLVLLCTFGSLLKYSD